MAGKENRKRIAYIDLAKGMGIILVVWGHANGPLTQYINQFHMPFFSLFRDYYILIRVKK